MDYIGMEGIYMQTMKSPYLPLRGEGGMERRVENPVEMITTLQRNWCWEDLYRQRFDAQQHFDSQQRFDSQRFDSQRLDSQRFDSQKQRFDSQQRLDRQRFDSHHSTARHATSHHSTSRHVTPRHTTTRHRQRIDAQQGLDSQQRFD